MAKDPIKKADNGTYYFRANLGYNPITGKQIQKYRSGFRTKKEAKEEYSKLVLASTEELTTKKDGVSFQQFIEETYLPWYKTQVKESTYLNRATTIKKHFSYFYKMETDEIEPIHVQNWQLKLAKDFSPNYIRIVQGILSIAFDRAIVLGIAKKNPSRMIGNIKSKKTKVDFWTLEEFQKVISLLCKKDYYEHYSRTFLTPPTIKYNLFLHRNLPPKEFNPVKGKGKCCHLCKQFAITADQPVNRAVFP